MKVYTLKEEPVLRTIAILEGATHEHIYENKYVNNWVKDMTHGKSCLVSICLHDSSQVTIRNNSKDIYAEFGPNNVLKIIERGYQYIPTLK